ncbi:hypothetical protein [Chitinolyticbacter meiyuanensis]|uniref:hypothetical protein n=1 Tax=Chitinolyticbacter meiyuanensis TaxID=682798 RepID=UPI001C9E7C8C|nr:hypothetical protein [Chitinolyticbacter meiyuanensis]
MMDDALIDYVAQAICRYLQQRPASADTLEGVHAWWIEWPDLPEAPAVTLAALERLEQQGVVERRHIGNRELWRACTRH